MKKVRILKMKKISIGKKVGGVITLAAAFVIGVAPMTAFAQENPSASEIRIETSVSGNAIADKPTETSLNNAVDMENVTEAGDTELPYSYTVNEDGSIVFNFNGEEYTYGAEEDPTGKLKENVYRLNVRTGAGMDYEVIDQLCPGEEVSVIGTEGNWYQIIVPEKTGYVHKNYLDVIESATNETDAALLQMFMMMFMDGLNSASGNNALTPDGNLNLIDDYGSATGAGKQFITLTTKNGNYFYLIIDRDDKGAETVHFLNLVDEADLLSLMEEEEVEAYKASQSAGIQAPEVEETEEEPTQEAEVEKQDERFNPIVVAPLIIVLIGGGIALALNMKKKKAENEVKPDPDADYEDESMQEYFEEEFIEDLPEDDEDFDLEEED